MRITPGLGLLGIAACETAPRPKPTATQVQHVTLLHLSGQRVVHPAREGGIIATDLPRAVISQDAVLSGAR